MKLEDFATVEEAADYSGVKYKTLLSRISKGTLPASRLGGKVFLIDRTLLPGLKAEQEKAEQEAARRGVLS